MALGICDVAGCKKKTLMGWRPHSVEQSEGKQICQDHWQRHKGPDSFSLFEAFGFPEPVLVIKAKPVKPKPIKHRPVTPAKAKPASLCDCGAELLPKKRYCPACAVDRERERKRQKQWLKKQPETTTQEYKGPACKRCGGPREPGHTYCSRCAKSSKRESKRAWAKADRT